MPVDKAFPLATVMIAGAGSALLLYVGIKKKDLGQKLRYIMIGLGAIMLTYNTVVFIRGQYRNMKVSNTLTEIQNKVESEFATQNKSVS